MEDQQKIDSKKAYIKALCEAKKEIKQPSHDSKVDFFGKKGGRLKFDYASLKEVLVSLAPLFNHGIIFSQNEVMENGKWFLRTTVSHVEGFEKSYDTFLKNNTEDQKEFASAITYARRYALCSIFGLYGQKDVDCLMDVIISENTPQSTPKPNIQQDTQPKFISKDLQVLIRQKMDMDKVYLEKMNKYLEKKNLKSITSIDAKFESYFRDSLEKKAVAV